MGNKKRKQDSDSDDDDASISAPQQKASATKRSTVGESKTPSKSKTVKKPKYGDSGDEGESGQPSVRVLMNAEGERYVDLGKKKRAAVRSFKGQTFVDIREFYGTEGDEKPGKKGISLTAEQWETFKQSIGTIDSFFAEQGKSS